MKLLKKKYFYHTGNVYDIQVASEDHSYIINRAVVHNSAAGCLISYLLDIVRLDPLKYDLLFERFLTKERAKKIVEEECLVVSLNNGSELELDFNERISIFRKGKKVSIFAKELRDGDEIFSVESRDIQEVLERQEKPL